MPWPIKIMGVQVVDWFNCFVKFNGFQFGVEIKLNVVCNNFKISKHTKQIIIQHFGTNHSRIKRT